tara:strand:+ start:153 stop:701 length:549 start_codon:yes stop_codon:yes gene_type:complete
MIKTKTIIEIAGSPKEHVEKTMELVLKEVANVEKTKLHGKEVFPIKENKDLFSMYAEIDLSFDDMETLYTFCFDFLPSSVDILDPLELKFDSMEFTNSFNDMLATLHQRDMMVKNTSAKNRILNMNMQAILKNFISYLCEEGLAIEALSKKIGIVEEQITPFLEGMEKDGKLKKEGDTYTRV